MWIKQFKFLVLCTSCSSVMLAVSKFLIAVYFVFVCAMDFVSGFLFGWFGLVYSHGIYLGQKLTGVFVIFLCLILLIEK